MNNRKHRKHLEEPKVALRRRISLKFCLHLTGHIASILITGAILQLSIRNVYRSDDGVWDYRWYMLNLGGKEEGDLLQILAKLHELIMVASLYGIVLHISRRLLVGSAGVPFGLLVGGYQPPGSYIIHKALWSPLLGSFRLRNWRFVLFALGLLFATVFANTLGPASAIALLPNLDWHTMRDPFLNIRPQTTTYHMGRENMTAEDTMHAFYPTILDRSAFEDEYHLNQCRSTKNSFFGDDCPGTDWEAIFSWTNTFTSTGANAKVQRLVGKRRYITANAFAATTLLRGANMSGVAVGTSLPFFVVDLFDQLWSLVSLKGMRAVEPERQRLRISSESSIFAPVVKVKCRGYDFESARTNNATLFFPTSWLDESTTQTASDQAWPIPQDIWNISLDLSGIRYAWVPVPQDDRRLHERVSIGVVFKLPSSIHGVVMPCTISSSWRRPDVAMDPTMNLRVENSFTETKALGGLGRPDYPGSVVRIEPEWADLGFHKPLENNQTASGDYSPYFHISASPDDYLSLFIETLLKEPDVQMNTNGSTIDYCESNILAESPEPGTSTICDPISMMLSLAFAQNMASVGYRHATHDVVLDSSNTTNLTTLDVYAAIRGLKGNGIFNTTLARSYPHPLNMTFEVERFGWGYGFQSSGNGTLIYAFAVLLLHSALVIVYLTYLTWFWCWNKGGYLSSAWDDLGELLALALASKEAKALGDAGAGVGSSATWDRRVMVRTRDYDYDKLDLVVRSDLAGNHVTGSLMVGKKYR